MERIEKKLNIFEEVRKHFTNLDPLTVTTSKEIYEKLVTKIDDLKYHTLREYIQRMAFGSPTSIRRNAKKFYSIYLNIPEIRDATGRPDVYLSLPGIERKYFVIMSKENIKHAQEAVYDKIGVKTAKFWVHRAQLNVGVSDKIKKKVRYRDNDKCRICRAITNAYRDANMPSPNHLNQGRHQVSHIIERRAIFWHLIEDINKNYKSIFCDKAVEEIETRIEQNKLYSGEEYLVYLCTRHDKIVQDVIKNNQLLK